MRKSLLVSTVGRPTKAVKTRVTLVHKYDISHILGVIPKADPKDHIYESILRGWEEEKKLIENQQFIQITECEVNIAPFTINPPDSGRFHSSEINDYPSYSVKNQDAEIIRLAKKIVEEYNREKFSRIFFDIGSGRRTLSIFCFVIAQWFSNLLSSSKEEVKQVSSFLKNFQEGNIFVLTRPTRSPRTHVQESGTQRDALKKSAKSGEVDNQKFYTGIHEFQLRSYPVLGLRDVKALQYLRSKDKVKQAELGNVYVQEFGLKSGDKNARAFRELLVKYKFTEQKMGKSVKLTKSGYLFGEFSNTLMDLLVKE